MPALQAVLAILIAATPLLGSLAIWLIKPKPVPHAIEGIRRWVVVRQAATGTIRQPYALFYRGFLSIISGASTLATAITSRIQDEFLRDGLWSAVFAYVLLGAAAGAGILFVAVVFLSLFLAALVLGILFFILLLSLWSKSADAESSGSAGTSRFPIPEGIFGPTGCKECDSPASFLTIGNGKCNKCHGSGNENFYGAVAGDRGNCRRCGGSGACPRCGGKGQHQP